MLKDVVYALEEIIYPCYCLICHKRIHNAKTQDSLCANCIEKLSPHSAPFCVKCGRKITGFFSHEHMCKSCPKTHFHFDRAWAGYAYEGTIKEMLNYFKYKHKIKLGRALARIMIDFVKEYRLPIGSCDYVIPIPLSPARLREREFNQAHILAKDIARYLKLQLLDKSLKRIRNTKSQTELDNLARWKNIQGAFKLKAPDVIKDKTILLIDDVLTTGATASEAAKTLKSAGASAVFVLTLAN